ncbi:MAG: 1,2-phenylacetyl-CoA epoxidase subunit PaaE [Pseudomonadota bacterium]
MSGLHFHTLRVSRVEADTDEARIVSFAVPDALRDEFAFQPGQYLTLRRRIGGEDLRRSYSICASPDEGELRVGVRKVPGGAFSSWLHEALQAGDELDALAPQGKFIVPAGDGAARHLLLVAGGSGITPMMAIARHVLASEPATRITLVYANRKSASAMFKEELEDIKNANLARFSLFALFSREAVEAPLNAGRLDQGKMAALLATVIDARGLAHAFVCGPHGMNDAVQAALLDAGLASERIHIERFGVPPGEADAHLHDARPGDAAQARITVIRDGVTREIAFTAGTPSLLDAAALAGLDVPFSCKSGVCATCRAKLLDGRVRMDRNFALDVADLAAGFILTCQSHPLTERVTVSYDER